HGKDSKYPAPPKFKRGGSPNKGQSELDFRRNSQEPIEKTSPYPNPIKPNPPDPSLTPNPPKELSLLSDMPVAAFDQVFNAWAIATNHTRTVPNDSRRRIFNARRKEG